MAPISGQAPFPANNPTQFNLISDAPVQQRFEIHLGVVLKNHHQLLVDGGTTGARTRVWRSTYGIGGTIHARPDPVDHYLIASL